MIVRETVCGKELFFDDNDLNKIREYSFHCVKGRVYAKHRKTEQRLTIYSLLFGKNTKLSFENKNGNNLDFQKENIIQRVRRQQKPISKKEYKGVIDNNGYLQVEVLILNKKKLKISLKQYDETKAAGIYNAMCDHLGIDGYRNPVPKIELTVEQKVSLDNKYAKIKEKANNEKPL